MSGFRDIHSHFVYGVDDGARTEKDMQAMLDAAQAEGITDLYATPHVVPGIKPFDKETFDRHLKRAADYCYAKGYELALHKGAEIMYTPAIRQQALDNDLPTLGETDFVLMEFSPSIRYAELEEAVELMEMWVYRDHRAYGKIPLPLLW